MAISTETEDLIRPTIAFVVPKRVIKSFNKMRKEPTAKNLKRFANDLPHFESKFKIFDFC